MGWLNNIYSVDGEKYLQIIRISNHKDEKVNITIIAIIF